MVRYDGAPRTGRDFMKARINWRTKEMGGRSHPPAGGGSPPYHAVIRFTDADEAWPPEIAWSLIVEKQESVSTEYCWIADIRFLVDHAPHGVLLPGRRFELYEGEKSVASGEILAG